MSLALVLTSVAPEIGGVLVRGEKGTAKSTLVRALAAVLPEQDVIAGCRFGCDPGAPDPECPDTARHEQTTVRRRPHLVELPVGAGEDRVTGSLDLSAALSEGHAAFEPGLLAAANRGILYVDEVNLLPDHLVDVLLDAAAMGRNTVERDGVSVSHAARMELIGTMNPEEGELRPQLLDRFGLTVEVAASRDPQERAEVVRRRLAFDSDPESFTTRYADAQADLSARLAAARKRLPEVELSDRAMAAIARVCAGFDVDGMRADIVTARAALAHAAWRGGAEVLREDIRAAAMFALPHRRRRNPFDAPGMDEDLLDQLLDESGLPDDPHEGPDGPDGPDDGPGGGEQTNAPDAADNPPAGADAPAPTQQPGAPEETADAPHDTDAGDTADAPSAGVAPIGVAGAETPYRAKAFEVRGVGEGALGRRSKARTDAGRTVSHAVYDGGSVHLPATIRSAALREARSAASPRRLRIVRDDLRRQVREGREANLVLFVVDASGSMAAHKRMTEVKTAVLSLLLDAYQRRDQVSLISFRGRTAELTLPPTSSVDAAAARLAELPHGGRTPLAEGLELTAHTLRLARLRDPRRRPLVVLVTDGRATATPDALDRANAIADRWPETGWETLVLDCEAGRMRLALAARLAARMHARHVPVGDVAAQTLVDHVAASTTRLGRSA
nr:VWA domain-containing protein [Flexivirga aerilata]